MKNFLKLISSFWKELIEDSSLFVFLMGIILVITVGIIEEGYNTKYNKIRIDYNERRKENLFQKSLIDSQRQTIDKQKELIDELLKQLKEEKRGKIYA